MNDKRHADWPKTPACLVRHVRVKSDPGREKNRAEIKDAWAEHNCHRLITGLSLTCRYAACLHAELHAGFKIGSLILTAGIATARAVIRA